MFKYRINHFLSCLPMSVSISGFAQQLLTRHKITSETFAKDRAIKMGDPAVIPLKRLKIYASEFEIEVRQLYQTVPKA